MRYFLFVSLFLVSCGKPYKDLVLQQGNITTRTFQPEFTTELFRCTVDGKFLFKKFHLSGLLYFKNFSDTATRVVFQNEMGLTYFDFGWDKQAVFQVNYIMEQMDKPALINTLKKDFELLMFKNIEQSSRAYFKNNSGEAIFRFKLPKGFAYYILDGNNALKGIENADEKRKVVCMDFAPPNQSNQFAEQITIKHLRANFSISLKKLQQDVTE